MEGLSMTKLAMVGVTTAGLSMEGLSMAKLAMV
jgi:hypothetical protein